ncbi:hypothetical protein EON65_54245 [archaeon]|nr:MAG: hypothetical protein EON65_54245 [archaeon]
MQQNQIKSSRKRQRSQDSPNGGDEDGNNTIDTNPITPTSTNTTNIHSMNQNKRQRTHRDNESILSSLYNHVVGWSRTLWGVFGFTQTSQTNNNHEGDEIGGQGEEGEEMTTHAVTEREENKMQTEGENDI